MLGCQRGVDREDGGSAPKEWPGGTMLFEVPWTAIEIVTEIPDPKPEMVGRQFVCQDAEGNAYTFNIGVLQDRTPYIDCVNAPSGQGGMAFCGPVRSRG
jgi:hypothetical protein